MLVSLRVLLSEILCGTRLLMYIDPTELLYSLDCCSCLLHDSMVQQERGINKKSCLRLRKIKSSTKGFQKLPRCR